jgi:sugar phosphate isomerase/epimerase
VGVLRREVKVIRLCTSVVGNSSEKIALLQRLGLTGTAVEIAPTWPLSHAQAVVEPFRAAGIAIVQTSCYRNLVATDEQVRARGIQEVIQVMELAGAVGIPAVVCGGGHRDPTCPAAVFSVHADTWSERALDTLIESCQEIVAAVSPGAAVLCLEPWVVTTLDSPERLARVIERVSHPKLGVELDPVNLMTIERYVDTGRFLTHCFKLLGDRIKLVHAKDTLLRPTPFTYHMSEAVPGDGALDYAVLLRLMDRLPTEVPLVIEHLSDETAIARARDYILGIGRQIGCSIL